MIRTNFQSSAEKSEQGEWTISPKESSARGKGWGSYGSKGNFTDRSHKGHREMPESSDRVHDRKRDQKAFEKEARASQKFQQDPDSFKHSHRPSYPEHRDHHQRRHDDFQHKRPHYDDRRGDQGQQDHRRDYRDRNSQADFGGGSYRQRFDDRTSQQDRYEDRSRGGNHYRSDRGDGRDDRPRHQQQEWGRGDPRDSFSRRPMMSSHSGSN